MGVFTNRSPVQGFSIIYPYGYVISKFLMKYKDVHHEKVHPPNLPHLVSTHTETGSKSVNYLPQISVFENSSVYMRFAYLKSKVPSQLFWG